MFNLDIFGVDFVKVKTEMQRIILIVLLLIILWNPIYTVALLIVGFVVQNHVKFKRYYIVALIIGIVIFACLIGYFPIESLLPDSWQAYFLYPIPPVRMIASMVLTLIFSYFEFGNVDKWMIEEECRKQKQIFSNSAELNFENTSHMFVAGTTGSGKSQMLLKYIRESLKNNEPLYIISGKGSGDKGSLLENVKEMAKIYNRKLYIVSMNENEKERVPYNPFKKWKIIESADALCNATKFTEPHYQQHLSCWIKVIGEVMKLANIPFSLPAIVDFMKFENFKALCEELNKKRILSDEELLDYLSFEDIAKIASTSRARFLNILLGEGKEIIGKGDDICASDIMEENAILFLDMDSFSYTDFTQVIGAFFINDMRHIVRHSTDSERKRIIMDELATFVTPQLMPLFSQARSYGYQLIVATQSIADLDEISPVFAERVMENCGQYGILQLNSANDAERISMIIGTKISVETTRKSTGMQLHFTADGSKKVVNAFKITPDRIKELKPLEVLFYDKKEPDKVKDIQLKYGWKE